MATSHFYALTDVFDDLSQIMNSVCSASASTYNTGTWTYPTISGTSQASYPPSTWTLSLEDLEKEYRKVINPNSPTTAVFDRAKSIYQNLPSFPAVDIFLDKDKGTLFFDIALPGYTSEDIDISFEDDYMLLEVKKENNIKRTRSEEGDQRVYLRRGLKSGSISFRVPVPGARFDVQKALAAYENGMLHIEIPRLEGAGPHRLSLKLKEIESKG